MKTTNQKKGKAQTSAATKKTTKMSDKSGKIIDGIYYFKTPAEYREKCKLIYLVCFHQINIDSKSDSFHSEQIMEFADTNPLVARRQAFAFAKSVNVYPNNKPLELAPLAEVEKRDTPSKFSGFRWCQIECLKYNDFNRMFIYFETVKNPTPAHLCFLEEELELIEQMGFADQVQTIVVKDEDGDDHRIIAEGNSFAMAS